MHAHSNPVKSPLCPACGRAMVLVRTVPRLGGLPELHSFECRQCGVTLTQACDEG